MTNIPGNAMIHCHAKALVADVTGEPMSTPKQAEDDYPIKLKIILNEFTNSRRGRVVAKLTLSTGQVLFGRPVSTMEETDDCFLLNDHETDGETWVALAHVVTIEEWIFDEE